MQRLLLLHLEDGDVDVLARVAELDPRPEVLLIHPDPSETVRRLADLAELPITGAPPEPQAGDVVVIPPHDGDAVAKWVESFRKAGARLVAFEDLGRDAVPEGTEVEAPPAGEDRGIDGTTAPPPVAEAAAPPEPAATPGPPEPPAASAPPVRAAARPRPAPSAPPPDIWTDPATTFRYLVRVGAGDRGDATVWWDGDAGVWIPILSGSAPPEASGTEAPRGRTLRSEWGRLVLNGDGADALNPDAVTRVAEDVVLRDLAAWRKTAEVLAGHGLPGRNGGGDAVRAWTLPVLDALRVDTALLWRLDGGEWHLLLTRGNDVRLSGELVLSEAVFETSFGKLGRGWSNWEPAQGLLMQLASRDRALPLRLHRVERVLHGHVEG